jgi:O-antigen chain-terminating methyltransferase
LFRWILGPALHHQTSYNVQNFLFLAELKAFVERMETDHYNYLREQREELIDLRNRYYQTSQRQAFLEKHYIGLNELEEKIIPRLKEQAEKFAERLIDQDQAISFQKRKLDAIFTKFQEAVDGKPGAAESVLSERNKLDEFDYYLFENLHRGSIETIRERQRVYLPYFQGRKNVVDIGCGRGEMLELFKENGIPSRGIDTNEEMVRVCREKGLDVTSADALRFLEALPEKSLGGLISAQVIEHIPSDHLVRLVRLAFEKLEPGSPIALETVNPQCLTTFSGAFYLDMSHIKPVHPEAVRFLLERAGFRDVRVIYLTPYPDELKLKKIEFDRRDEPARTDDRSENGSGSDHGFSAGGPEKRVSGRADWEAAVAVYNENVEKLNRILFSHQDYAVVATR